MSLFLWAGVVPLVYMLYLSLVYVLFGRLSYLFGIWNFLLGIFIGAIRLVSSHLVFGLIPPLLNCLKSARDRIQSDVQSDYRARRD